jgi:hypothetical protein
MAVALSHERYHIGTSKADGINDAALGRSPENRLVE